MLDPLPIDSHLDTIRDLVRKHRAAVVVAPPGAGKRRAFRRRLAEDGPVIVLQPRRLAARSLARRIAAERGWTLGEEAGWHVRFDRKFSAATRVLVATEGILTARLQSDPLLSGFRTVDRGRVPRAQPSRRSRARAGATGVARARRPQHRRDVRDARRGTGRALPRRRADRRVDGTAVPRRRSNTRPASRPPTRSARSSRGPADTSWCFSPAFPRSRASRGRSRAVHARGARRAAIRAVVPRRAGRCVVAVGRRRRVILATNVAETSITVPGVTTVIDTGLHKAAASSMRRSASIGWRPSASRSTPPTSARDARDAPRPGRAVRLWDPRDVLRPHREPEIERVDLAAPVLEVLAWGGDPTSFAWFEAPPADERRRRDGALDGAGRRRRRSA